MRSRLLSCIVMVLPAVCAAGCVSSEQRAFDHYVRGQLLIDQGRLDAALAELAEAVKTDPELSIAYESAGSIHRRRGNLELARRSYESACDTNPYAFRPHYNLGVTYQMLADAARGFERLQQYLRQATRVYLRAITIRPDDFEANLNLSACYFQLGKSDLAEQYCRAAIRINGSSAQAYSNLGIIYDSQNRLYEAISAYKSSLEMDPRQPDALIHLGSTYMRQGRLKDALRNFRRAAAEAPSDPEPWQQIGSCYFHMRDYPKALEAYQKALSLDERNAAAHRGMGVVYMSQFVIDRKRTDLRAKALEHWNTSLEIEPNQKELIRLVQKYSPRFTSPQL